MSKVSKEDSELFRQSIGAVQRHRDKRSLLEKAKPAPVPYKSREDANQVMDKLLDDPFTGIELETGDELFYHRPGVQKNTVRKLKKGQYVIQGELDLHGYTVAEAKPVLSRYVKYAISAGKTCIRIIHGKGKGSKNRLPVLKNKVAHWLQQDGDVMAFVSAPANDGGTGAVYVLLKKQS